MEKTKHFTPVKAAPFIMGGILLGVTGISIYMIVNHSSSSTTSPVPRQQKQILLPPQVQKQRNTTTTTGQDQWQTIFAKHIYDKISIFNPYTIIPQPRIINIQNPVNIDWTSVNLYINSSTLQDTDKLEVAITQYLHKVKDIKGIIDMNIYKIHEGNRYVITKEKTRKKGKIDSKFMFDALAIVNEIHLQNVTLGNVLYSDNWGVKLSNSSIVFTDFSKARVWQNYEKNITSLERLKTIYSFRNDFVPRSLNDENKWNHIQKFLFFRLLGEMEHIDSFWSHHVNLVPSNSDIVTKFTTTTNALWNPTNEEIDTIDLGVARAKILGNPSVKQIKGSLDEQYETFYRKNIFDIFYTQPIVSGTPTEFPKYEVVLNTKSP